MLTEFMTHQTLSMAASLRLLKLFGSLSRRNFLFFKDKNHRYIFFLLEMLNNVLQYQYEGNTFLVYAIISNKALFYNLADLAKTSLAEGVQGQAGGAGAPLSQSAELPSTSGEAPKPAEQQQQPAKQVSTVQQVASGETKFAPTDDWVRFWIG
jgi:hypothetical protein